MFCTFCMKILIFYSSHNFSIAIIMQLINSEKLSYSDANVSKQTESTAVNAKNWLKYSFPSHVFAICAAAHSPISYMTDRHTAPLCITQRFVCVHIYTQCWANKLLTISARNLSERNLYIRDAQSQGRHLWHMHADRFCIFLARVPRADARAADRQLGPMSVRVYMHCYCFKAYLFTLTRYLIKAPVHARNFLSLSRMDTAPLKVCVIITRGCAADSHHWDDFKLKNSLYYFETCINGWQSLLLNIFGMQNANWNNVSNLIV